MLIQRRLRLLPILVSLLLLSGGSGCRVHEPITSNPTTGSATTSSLDTDSTISILMPQIRWLPQFKDQLDRFVNLYLAVKEQQVSIELEIPAPEQYDLLRRQRLAAGTGPDVIALRSLAEIRQFAAAGLLGDMTGEDWFARLYPVIQDAVRIDGHVMALPLDGQAAGYLYNQQLFNALALQPAETQAEMRQNITAIRAAGKMPFLAAELTTEDAARPLLLIINALAPAANQFSFAKMNAGQCSLQDLPDLFTGIDLIQVNANADGLTTSRAVGAQRFTSGDYAMWIQGSAAAEDVLALKPDFNLGLAPWPVGNDPSQARLQFSLTVALAITAHCPNQPLAKSVVAYCLDVTSSADFFAAGFTGLVYGNRPDSGECQCRRPDDQPGRRRAAFHFR